MGKMRKKEKDKKKCRGVYSFPQLEKFPPPLIFQLDFLPQENRKMKHFLFGYVVGGHRKEGPPLELEHYY